MSDYDKARRLVAEWHNAQPDPFPMGAKFFAIQAAYRDLDCRIAAALAEEREACAQIADLAAHYVRETGLAADAAGIAAAIRLRALTPAQPAPAQETREPTSS